MTQKGRDTFYGVKPGVGYKINCKDKTIYVRHGDDTPEIKMTFEGFETDYYFRRDVVYSLICIGQNVVVPPSGNAFRGAENILNGVVWGGGM